MPHKEEIEKVVNRKRYPLVKKEREQTPSQLNT
jgi:hypothetical protein